MQRCSLLAAALLLAGCARLSPPPSSSKPNADSEFARLSDDYLAGYLAWRPQLGTTLGFHQYDGKLTDYSKASLTAERARLGAFERRLAALDPRQLSRAISFDLRLLQGAIRREIFTFDDLRGFELNPITYAGALDVNIYVKRDFAPLESRVRSLTAILNQAPQVFAAARANLAPSLARPLVQTALEVATGAADFLAKDLVEALKDFKSEPLESEFVAADQRAVAELRGYASWLKTEKLPRANDRYALGREKYARLLRTFEGITLTPEHLLGIGLKELAAEQKTFREGAALIDPSRPPIDVFQSIQKDHPTVGGLITDATKDLETIRQFVSDHHLVTIPSTVRAQVTETPQYLRATSFASMDTPGPFETRATEAYYYITPAELAWTSQQQEEWLGAFNYYTLDVVSIHEAYPGHYVQFLCLNASPANRLEKVFASYAFVEGWAHYAEKMMLDEGFGAASATAPSADARLRAAKYRLAQSDEALLRLCRFCVSIKMHCQGMTVEEAAKFFQENCYYGKKPSEDEAARGVFDPEYLYYTLGKLEILKLRADYRRQEGAAFTLQRFHDELLRHGAPPLRLLRELLLRDPATWDHVLD